MKLLKDILYMITGMLVRLKRSVVHPGTILVVRVDEIGDYILWRPFLNRLAAAPEFIGKEIHLCGNASWKSIHEVLDAESVTHRFWLDKHRFKRDLLYRYRFLGGIRARGYDTVINPTFSRDRRYDDAIVLASGANRRIGMRANRENVRWYDDGYDRGLYDLLFACSPDVLFEFHRNAEFFAQLTRLRPLPGDIRIDGSRLPKPPSGMPADYFIVFTGSRSASRRWPLEYFLKVSEHIASGRLWKPVLCGSPADRERNATFKNMWQGECVDLTGQTSLPELLTVIGKAHCVLTVDTGSVHLAAAMGTTVFGVFNGSQYGRFSPYPSSISDKIHPVYPKMVRPLLADPKTVELQFEFTVEVPYESVEPEDVMEVVDKVLP